MPKKNTNKARPIRQKQGTYERVIENKKKYNRKKIKNKI